MYLALLLALGRSICAWMNAESESEACCGAREKHVCSSDAKLAIATTAWTEKELSVRPIDTVGCLQGLMACGQAILTAQDPATVACRPPTSPAAFPKVAVRSDPSQRKSQGRRCCRMYLDSLIMGCMIKSKTRCLPCLAPRLGVALFEQELRMTSERTIARFEVQTTA